MKNKNTNNLEFSTILGNVSDKNSNGKNYIFQSSTFRLIFSFINLYALILILLFFIVKGNLVGGIDNNFLNTGFLSVLNARAILLFLLLISLNISAYFNYGFKYVCLILLAYMINSAIDNAVLFSGFMHITDRPYFSAFSATRPLFIIALFWVLIIHKDNKKAVKSV
ncbi:hypothetical protein N9V53_07310 [Amylibacter sp.]|nr:hypothetical protein [Amylibacter sp.]MDB4017512.1 hypothetical protein [Amylibacter sp.]MDC0096666.1 hypothetical protein [Amylibacter sp.]